MDVRLTSGNAETSAPFIYINGYAGVGKFTIAKCLLPLLPHPAKVFDNHLVIDPVAALIDRTSSEYQPLRKSVRQLFLSTISNSAELKHTAIVFTDQQSSSAIGSSVARDYEKAAKRRPCQFLSIRIECEEEEHIRRATDQARKDSRMTKLTDEALLRRMRMEEDVFSFGGEDEITIDVTELSPEEAGERIFTFLCRRTVHTTSSSLLHRQLFGNISGFKHLFIAEILTSPINSQVNFLAWVVSRPRSFGQLVFVDVVDSSGRVQVVVELHRFSRSNNPTAISLLRPESSVYVQGTIIAQGASGLNIEIRAHAIEVISAATAIAIEPPIRGHSQDVLSPQLTDKILSNRHLYLRNPILLSIGKFRSEVLFSMRKWFHSQSFLDISTPIITSSILYEPRSAISITGPVESNKPLFLSQCAGFYLEAAAHAHERVYNLGPSFRNESRTNRHLMEYWHVKAELTSGKLDDIMSLVEIFLRDIRSDCEWFGIQTASLLGNVFPEDFSLPFPRITYVEAQAYLSTRDEAFQFGQNISNHHERMLTEQFCSRGNSPLWITHKPRVLEPFPYAIHPHDTRLTMTADLVAPDGFGEICGVAEKSYRLSDLHERLKEKGMDGRKEYEWVRDMRHYGMVPHVAFGMGLERVIRWWIGAKHVKDTIPFPRLFGRVPLP